MCTSKPVCKAKWVLCFPQGLSNFGDWSCIFAFWRAPYHSQGTMQTLSGVVEGVWGLVRAHPMDNDRSCQLAQAQLQDHTNQCCQPATNQLLQINPFLLHTSSWQSPFQQGSQGWHVQPWHSPKCPLGRSCCADAASSQSRKSQSQLQKTSSRASPWCFFLQQWILWPVLPVFAMKALACSPSCAEPRVPWPSWRCWE